ncbi:NUDIX domain-containing protein [Kribbella caucasensis]|uniref:NUDIX domain-containing protein n=1 Tax=Kribbella caucasensis TaxID=2512215 RepID=UPI00192D5E5C
MPKAPHDGRTRRRARERPDDVVTPLHHQPLGWELRGGYVDPDYDPAVTAAREVEEAGWRSRNVEPLASLQPSVGTTDAPNLLVVSHGADHIGDPEDINETQRNDWIRLASLIPASQRPRS